jgi:hypothetical protein
MIPMIPFSPALETVIVIMTAMLPGPASRGLPKGKDIVD